MPLIETLPVRADTAQWTVWSTTARVVVTDPAAIDEAAGIVRDELAAVDAACSRFRPDSELNRACRAGRPTTVSPLLADLVAAALDAAAETDGDVDPTVGAALCGLGYDRDFAAVTGRAVAPAVRVFPAPDWRAVELRDRELTVPHGVRLDLGATAKAAAADRAATLIALRLGVGALVALGGDIATAGPNPQGWSVRVEDRPGDPHCTVKLPAGAALATSSTVARTWGRPGELLHHIVDPRTGRPAPRVWRTVSVAAFSCVRANTLTTAAIVRGHDATALLAGVPARLVTPHRDVLTLGGWPS
jgi:thiamine biosynthesis lipoprotein